LEKRLILEIDGGQHDLEREKDEKRTNWLESEGYRVLRFWNNEVLTNIEGVLKTILLNIFPDSNN
jgi:very-short-patch-repair endonuclease